ncbi:hypothetical protein B0H17DRAFT_1140598 [Mycena rosella]|uniref:DUF6534 domain-containing protein n=1 Tax=Mycena rosella TaxID=1033263 RepID=A0AAD7G7F7_MYCRO|nr:hypothetical protein B0H17DRAFT_1140598 [Mycena rosella]
MTAEYVIVARETSKLGQLSVVADASTIFRVSMIIVFHCAKTQSSFTRTESLLNRLLIATSETGVVTASFPLLTLVLFKVFPNSYYFLTTEFVMGKMYATVLFAALNGHNFGTEMDAITTQNMGTSRIAGDSIMRVFISTTVETEKRQRSDIKSSMYHFLIPTTRSSGGQFWEYNWIDDSPARARDLTMARKEHAPPSKELADLDAIPNENDASLGQRVESVMTSKKCLSVALSQM